MRQCIHGRAYFVVSDVDHYLPRLSDRRGVAFLPYETAVVFPLADRYRTSAKFLTKAFRNRSFHPFSLEFCSDSVPQPEMNIATACSGRTESRAVAVPMVLGCSLLTASTFLPQINHYCTAGVPGRGRRRGTPGGRDDRYRRVGGSAANTEVRVGVHVSSFRVYGDPAKELTLKQMPCHV